jgi:hypothetical protein
MGFVTLNHVLNLIVKLFFFAFLTFLFSLVGLKPPYLVGIKKRSVASLCVW